MPEIFENFWDGLHSLVVCERNSFQIPQIYPIVASFLAPKGASPLIYSQCNPHSLKMLPTKLFSGFGE